MDTLQVDALEHRLAKGSKGDRQPSVWDIVVLESASEAQWHQAAASSAVLRQACQAGAALSGLRKWVRPGTLEPCH